MLPENPSILVLLVATDGARWLPDALRGLRAQKHRPITALGVDNASSDGSGEMLTKAFGVRRVVTLERRVGYGRALAAALKVAAEREIQADAFLLVHDDAALAPGSVEAMVEAMREHDAGIVGAKLVEWDRPELLQEVGAATDRYGRLVPHVERGEIDQGQHDGVRETLYASSAVMLVSREVVEKVGLFDLRYVGMRDDLDLCWRARLAGFSTVVTTEAKARHAMAGARGARSSPLRGRTRYFVDRNVLATLIKNYSMPRLLVTLPVAIAIALGVAMLSLVTGRQSQALQTLEALQWNVVHLPSTLRARVRVQQGRTRRDGEVLAHMRRGATKLRAQFEQVVERIVGAPEQPIEDLDAPPPHVFRRLAAHPGAVAIAVAVVVVLTGARGLLAAGPVAGLDLAPFPRAGGFLNEWASGWRGTGLGGAGPATPGMVLLAILTLLSAGSAWLAQRVLLLGLPVFGAVSMWRLLRAFGVTPGARRLAIALFAASPLVLGAYGAGRLPDLILFTTAPALLLPLLRAAGVLPHRGWRSAAAGVVGLAAVASLAPYALVLVAGAGLVLALASLGAHGVPRAVLARTGLMTGGALILLFPWSIELFRARSPIWSGGTDGALGMRELLALSPGTVRPLPLWASFGLAAAAAAGIVVAPAARRRAAAVLGSVSVIAVLLAWAVARGVTVLAPRPSLPLAVAVVALAVLAAIAFEAAGDALPRRSFGVMHVAFALLGIMLALQLGGAALWVLRSETPGLVEAGELLPQHLAEEARRTGAFRVAWIGGSVAQPTAALSGPEGITMRQYLARPAGSGAAAFERAVAAIAGGATEAGGRMLATLGVRYVVVRPEADAALHRAVEEQGDLSFFQRFAGGAVFVNDVGLPIGAAIAAPGWLRASEASSVEAVAAAEPRPDAAAGFGRRGGTRYRGEVPEGAGAVLLAEDFSRSWRARTAAGASIVPQRSFGWAMRLPVEGPSRLRIEYRQGRHRAALLVQIVIWLGFVSWWSRRAARERGER